MAANKTKTRRATKVILVISLAFNLLIVGVVVGAFMNGGRPGGMQRFDLTVGALTRAMEGEHRDAVREALRDSGAFRPADRAALRADMIALLATLRADAFDEAAFREALMRQRERLRTGQATVLDVVATQIDAMSVQERSAFADRLEQQMRNGPPPRRQRQTLSSSPSGG